MEDNKTVLEEIDHLVIMPKGLDVSLMDTDFTYFLLAIESGLEELENQKCSSTEFYEVVKHIFNSMSSDFEIEHKSHFSDIVARAQGIYIEDDSYNSVDEAHEDFITSVQSGVVRLKSGAIGELTFYNIIKNACMRMDEYLKSHSIRGCQYSKKA